MSQFKDGLKKARGSMVFLFGITFAFGTVFGLEQWQPKKTNTMVVANAINLIEPESLPLRDHRPLNATEQEMAQTAWTYFSNNTIEDTGLVNSVDGYTAATLWDTSSYMLALVSARDLGIIDTSEFDSRLRKLLKTLAKIPLFEDRLPNKAYSTTTASMTTYDNQPTDRGVGWSAICLLYTSPSPRDS